MKHVLFAAALSLSAAACGGPAAASKPDRDAASAPDASGGSEKRPGRGPAPSGKRGEADAPPLPHADRKDDPTVLVPGDPPLTQGMMDRDIDLWEWLLDLRLTEPQRSKWQSLWMAGWKKMDDKGKAEQLTDVKGNVEFWENMGKLSEEQRDLERLRFQAPDLARLRKSPEALDAWLAGLYDESHKPGGERNPILVASDPPLTQDMMNLYRIAMEYVLDVHMTDRQRDEFQRAFIADWKKNDPQQYAKGIESWRKPLSGRPYGRRIWRAQERPLLLGNLPMSKDESDRWLLAVYEAAQEDHKPGSERNPLLVDADPPLTRDVVNQYCIMVEGVLDFSISGGLTDEQRQDLEDYLVQDWKGMDKAAREDFLRTLQKWPSQARFLVQLRAAPAGDQRSQYLLEIHNREVEKFNTVLKRQEEEHQVIMDLYRIHWTYNPWTGEYEPDAP